MSPLNLSLSLVIDELNPKVVAIVNLHTYHTIQKPVASVFSLNKSFVLFIYVFFTVTFEKYLSRGNKVVVAKEKERKIGTRSSNGEKNV